MALSRPAFNFAKNFAYARTFGTSAARFGAHGSAGKIRRFSIQKFGWSDIVFHLFHLVNTFGLSELVQKLVNIIDLLEIIINVAKDFRHLILEHFNEVLLFVGGRITVHLVATISDFLEHVLGSCQSLAQLVRFLGEKFRCIMDILLGKLVIKVDKHVF